MAVPVCYVLDCTRTIGRYILCQVLVRCAAISFQQRGHCLLHCFGRHSSCEGSVRLGVCLVCRSLRWAPFCYRFWLARCFDRWAPIRFGSRYCSTCLVDVKMKKAQVRRRRLIPSAGCSLHRSLLCSFGHLFFGMDR